MKGLFPYTGQILDQATWWDSLNKRGSRGQWAKVLSPLYRPGLHVLGAWEEGAVYTVRTFPQP